MEPILPGDKRKIPYPFIYFSLLLIAFFSFSRVNFWICFKLISFFNNKGPLLCLDFAFFKIKTFFFFLPCEIFGGIVDFLIRRISAWKQNYHSIFFFFFANIYMMKCLHRIFAPSRPDFASTRTDRRKSP